MSSAGQALAGLLVALSCVMLVPSAARADVGAGAFRLSLEGSLFQWESRETTPLDGSDATRSTETTLGVLAPALGVGLGYAISELFVVGARIGFATVSAAAGDVGTSSARYTVGPFGEVALAPGAWLRAMGTAQVGIRGSSSEEDDVLRASESAFFVALGVGLRMTLTPGLTLEPRVDVGLEWGSSDLGGVEADETAFTVAGVVALSGWLGGGDDPSDEEQ